MPHSMDYPTLISALLADGDQHSDVYQEGMCAALRLRIDELATTCPYPQGSAEFDAFYYGCCRGADEFRNAVQDARGDRALAIARLRALASTARRVA